MIARRIRIRGVVQGVGFRPFVYRLAQDHAIRGWVRNEADGVEIHAEGTEPDVHNFIEVLKREHPPAAFVSSLDVLAAPAAKLAQFTIQTSQTGEAPTVRISPDLPVCERCLAELFDPGDRRYLYPYINCTNCGPRFTIIESLPYDRARTTMRAWKMDDFCAAQYLNPLDRRFHAQPVACPACGPQYRLESFNGVIEGNEPGVHAAAALLRSGGIVAIKGIGGYHLSCDARNATAVAALRERKFRKEKPFALMVRSLEVARSLAEIDAAEQELLTSAARPIVLAQAKTELPGIAPESSELGIMLPYAPLHYLLFEAGAPDALVMTSANRSSEPIAYRDEEAREKLAGLADAMFIGARPIARRLDDSVARAGAFGPAILRRARGYAPAAVTEIPIDTPVLAVGADLKNAVTLVVDGQAFVSQHIGDLDHFEALTAFRETIRDLLAMYRVPPERLTVIHDLHPEYASTLYALEIQAREHRAVQHHRAHVASVIAERRAWDRRAVGVSFDGTGYGDDGTVWGGEFFVGSVREGWTRLMHLRKAALPGGDAAARYPVQCAAGFLSQVEHLPDLAVPPFSFPPRYVDAVRMVEKRVRTFETSSMGRLFDTAAALLGFTREITFEGQAAIWLEHLAQSVASHDTYDFPLVSGQLDFRPLLGAIVKDRLSGREAPRIARAFHNAVAAAVESAVFTLCESAGIDVAALSGGVFQNQLLVESILTRLRDRHIQVWMNGHVPSNDGGISLGQAASILQNAVR